MQGTDLDTLANDSGVTGPHKTLHPVGVGLAQCAGNNQLGEHPAAGLLCRIAKDLLCTLAPVGNQALTIHADHPVHRGVQDLPQAPLAQGESGHPTIEFARGGIERLPQGLGFDRGMTQLQRLAQRMAEASGKFDTARQRLQGTHKKCVEYPQRQ